MFLKKLLVPFHAFKFVMKRWQLTKLDLLVFCTKDLCEARPETPGVFKFSDVFLYLSQTDPLVMTSHGQEWY